MSEQTLAKTGNQDIGALAPRTCFVAGTLVRVHPDTVGAEVHGGQSYKRIETIVVGDRVLAWGEETGALSWRPVTQTFVRKADAIYKLTYADGTVVETTWSHPFYIEGRGWVKAKDLTAGDVSYTAPYVRMMARVKEPALSLAAHSVNEARTVRGAEDPMSGSVSASGSGIVSVEVVAQRFGAETVYNFAVAEDSNYFVARAEILVHNSKYAFDSSSPDAARARDLTRTAIGTLRGLGNDAEAMALLLESPLLGAGTLDDRLKMIFNATEKTGLGVLFPGLHISGGIFGDKGYADAFRDGSPNQTGHMLTALRLALDPSVVNDRFLADGVSTRAILEARMPEVKNMSDAEIAMRLSIGHEKYPDPGPHAVLSNPSLNPSDYLLRQFKAATTEDVANFRRALNALGSGDRANFAAAQPYLDRIKANESWPKWAPEWARFNQGNSNADLRLTLAGYDIARRKEEGRIRTQADAARYVRENLKK